MPYTFDEFVTLQAVRPKGPVAFGEALENLRPSEKAETDAQLRADFEAVWSAYCDGTNTPSQLRRLRSVK